MSWSREFQRADRAAGGVEVRLGHPVVDLYLDLFGKRVLLPEDQTYQFVTALIAVRAKTITVINLNGEIIQKTTSASHPNSAKAERCPCGPTTSTQPERCLCG